MQLQYKKVLLLGATGGIGRALAARFVETGTSVIVVGRRKEKLEEFTKQYGQSKVTVDSEAFDVTDLEGIPTFASKIFERHPDTDCVFVNSGIQRHIDWTKPEDVSLETIDMEIKTNLTAVLHLTKAFLPYLQKQAPKEMAMIYTSSGLALIPSVHAINYCATKAALHHTLLAMREQLRNANSNVKIIELFPPAVQTELHDYEMGEKGKHVGMPLNEFVDEAFEGLCREGKENEQVPVQGVKSFMDFYGWEQERQKIMLKMMRRE